MDEEEEIEDDSDIERKADRYATRILINGDSVPQIKDADYKRLAQQAAELESSTGADASMIIFAWARQTGEYGRATMAVNALYRGFGGRKTIRDFFDRHVDVNGAVESDRTLLNCLYSA